MAYRQYIGARYVPLFDGAWSATKNYEPLTVVEDGNGNSYTSKKDVPAGTPLTDRDYWMLTATFSGAVEQLRRDVTEVQENVETLTTDTAAMKEDIEEIREELSTVEGDNVILISDSYGVPGVTGGTSWLQDIIGMLPENWNVETYASGGLAFAYAADNLLSFQHYITDSVVPVTVFEATKVKKVLIAGGANDGNLIFNGTFSASEIAARTRDTINAITAAFPNAQISIAFVGNYKLRDHREAYVKARNAWKEGASVSKNGAFVDNAVYILRNDAYIGDQNIHPTREGSYQIALGMANYLKNGSLTVSYENRNVTLTPFSSNITFEGLKVFERLENNVASLYLFPSTGQFINAKIKFATGIDVYPYRPIQIGTLQEFIFNGMPDFSTCGHLTFAISGNVGVRCAGDIFVYDKVVYLITTGLNQNVTNVREMIITGCSMVIDSDNA